MLPIYKSNKLLILSYAVIAILVLFILLLPNSSVTNFLISQLGIDYDSTSGISANSIYIRYDNAVIYSGSGIILFCLLNVIKIFFHNIQINKPSAERYNLIVIDMLLWAIVFIFGDIVLQNIEDKSVTLSDFTMRYTAIGGLIGMEVIVLYDFFYDKKKGLRR